MAHKNNKLDRREFIKRGTITAAALGAGLGGKNIYAGKKTSVTGKVVIIGIDGMDPVLSEKLMADGRLPNLSKLAAQGGYRRLGTSDPPQSPVAWANFINGAGPGSHGIFDFIHRNPEKQASPFYSAAKTLPGKGYLVIGKHKYQLPIWPFNHEQAQTVLKREGTPFWDYLDEAGIKSVFYDLPSNYPASESKHGNHKCLSGMGTTDLFRTGTYGTYQHFAEDGPVRMKDEGGGTRSMLFFENETAKAKIIGPTNTILKNPEDITVPFVIHRDKKARAAVIEIQKHKILLNEKQWSKWIKLDFEIPLPGILPNNHISGICRFYVQEVEPNFRLYVSPINADPSDPAIKLTEPPEYIEQISKKLGLFYTTGFQEDHKALSNGVFNEEEFAEQAGYVLKERLNLLQYAAGNYDDGLLFFYFSSSDLQSHMFWWDSDSPHPTRSAEKAEFYFEHIKQIYQKLDGVVGDIIARYGKDALVMVMSDHGFANFKRQFNLNTWLRDNGYIQRPNATGVLRDVDWQKTKAYGLGINGLYLNLRGRERDGIVNPQEKEALTEELVSKLEAVRDGNGRKVIHKVHRSDKIYPGSETALAPDLIVGYSRDYRASWDTCLGDMGDDILSDNDSAWSADHCADSSQVPGVLFANKPVNIDNPALIDLAPSILTKFGLNVPDTMQGKNIFGT